MQRNRLPTTCETTWKGNPANREGPRKVPWQRQFTDKGLPLQLQFDSLGRVVNSSKVFAKVDTSRPIWIYCG